MKKNILHTSYLSIVALVATLTVGVGNVWGTNYSMTMDQHASGNNNVHITTTTANSNQNVTYNTVTWNVAWAGTGTPTSGSKTQCQFGTGSYPCSSVTISTSGISGTITAVGVTCSGASSNDATVSVSVGSTAFTNGKNTSLAVGTTLNEKSFSGSASGTITITISQSTSKAIYVSGVSVTYTACSNSMTISKGTGTNCSFSLGTSGSGIASCSGVSTTVTITPNTGYGKSPSVTQSGASAAPTISGSGNNWTVSYGANTTGTSTINVSCLANDYTVTLNDNTGSGGSGSKSVTYNSNTNLTTSVTVPTKAHHDFAGYWTSTDAGSTFGTKLVNADGSWVASAGGGSTYTDASKNWKYAGNITLYAKWTEHDLINYRTVCCTDLASIGGEVASSTKNSITLSWTKLSNVDATTPYEVEASDGTVGDIDLTGSKASCTITGLDPCTDYIFNIKAYGASGYCDQEEYVEGTTKGNYTYTITKTNVSLKGGETEATDNCDDFLAEYVASDGYALPATITVTGASDYTWEDGVLGIDKADVTGNVTVSIEGVAKWYYSGDDDDWDKTSMTLSSGGTYFYIQSSTDDHQFKIRNGNNWYGDNYLKPGFAMTNITALYDYSDGECDDCNCYCTYNNGSYYIIVFLGSTFMNNASTPVICASTTLPDDSPSGLAETKKIYLTPNSSWLGSSAKFAINYYGHGTAGWSDYMTQSPCDEDVWEVEIPKLYSDIIIVRMDPSESKGWGAKWNQTGDLRIPAGKNRLTLPASGTYEWNGATETWSAYTPDTYTISFDKGSGTSGSMSSLTGIACDASKALTANAFTKTGYSFSHWTADVDVTVDDATVDTGDPIDDEATIQNIQGDIALTAQWTANNYTVTLKATNATSGSDQTVSATYDSSMPLVTTADKTPAVAAISRTGYIFNGWWDNTTSGTQYYTYNAGTGAIASARNWNKASNTDLYAQWTAKQTTVSFNQNSGSGGQTTSKTATYDAAMPTPITCPTREGHTFGGYYESTGGTGKQYYAANGSSANNWDKEDATWTLYAKWTVNNYTLTWSWGGGSTSSTTHTAAGSVAYGTTLVYPANNTMSKTGHTFTGWSSTPSTMPATNTTITAQWSINSYNVAVLANSNVTITATPSGSSAIAESGNANVNYGTTVTLNYSSLGSGLTWGGWKVYKADDETPVAVSGTGDGATFTLPAYAVKVEAFIYSAGIAWCDPEIDVTDIDIHLTSYNGVPVYTTSGANNLIEISSSDFGSATRLEVAYLDADNADAEVDKAESVFRFCSSADYSTIDGLDLDYEWGTTHSIRYTPNAYNKRDNYKLQLILKRGDKVLKTVNRNIYGRALPQEFVIASKYLGHWYALPNTMGTATETVTPIQITVDNATTPTKASYAPSTTVYKGAARKTETSNRNSIRLTNDGSHWLITNNSNAQLGLSATETEGYENREVWYLKSSNFNVYELAMDPALSPSKKLGMYNGFMGMYADPAYTSEDIYLLPIGTKYTPVEATATDWTDDAIGVTATTSATKLSIKQQDGTETDPVTLSSDGTVHAADFDGDIDFTELTGNTILLKWYNGASFIGGSEVTVPSIILAGANDEWSDFAIAPTMDDIVVLSKPMTIGDAHAKAKQIVIDQSGDNTGKLTIEPNKGLEVASTVKVYNGTNFVATGEADLVLESTSAGNASLVFENAGNAATVQQYSKASIVGNTWNWQYVGTPFTGSIPQYNYYGSWMYKWNNGSWAVVRGSDELTPFTGYCLTQESATTHVMGGTLVSTTDDVEVTMGEETDMVLANSWTAPIYIGGFTEETFQSEPATIYLFNTGMAEDGAGEYDPKKEEAGTYVTVTVNAAEYLGTEFIAPMQGFFVTTNGDDGKAGSITLKYDDLVRPADSRGIVAGPMKAPKRAQENNRPAVLKMWANGSEYNDRVVILERADFSEGFDNGWDGKKMSFGVASPSVYVINAQGGYDAVSAIPDLEGTVVGFRAGADNNCTMTFSYEGDDTWYLNDLQAQKSTLISGENSYAFTTSANDSEVRFIISATPIQKVATGVENGELLNGANGVRKVLINDHIYIIRSGRIYSVDGVLVK